MERTLDLQLQLRVEVTKEARTCFYSQIKPSFIESFGCLLLAMAHATHSACTFCYAHSICRARLLHSNARSLTKLTSSRDRGKEEKIETREMRHRYGSLILNNAILPLSDFFGFGYTSNNHLPLPTFGKQFNLG